MMYNSVCCHVHVHYDSVYCTCVRVLFSPTHYFMHVIVSVSPSLSGVVANTKGTYCALYLLYLMLLYSVLGVTPTSEAMPPISAMPSSSATPLSSVTPQSGATPTNSGSLNRRGL